jgi:hypothetical protein
VYATVRNYEGNAALADALVENESEVKRLISGIDGFKAYYLIRSGNGTTSVSVYESQEGAEESNRIAGEWVRENLPDLAVAAPSISAGEVALSM